MKDKKLLVLRLEGALQSWGEHSKWDFRDSGIMPTKSGIVGLLSCALGFEREDPRIVELSETVTIAVRADRIGYRAVDFQTVTGNHLLNAQGKPKSGGDTIISHREYREDACYTVVVETTDQWHERLVKALKSPRWCIYLGRKNCVPSRPVLECAEPKFSSLEECIFGYPTAERVQYPMSIEWSCEMPGCVRLSRADECACGYKNYNQRTVWRGSIVEDTNDSVQN